MGGADQCDRSVSAVGAHPLTTFPPSTLVLFSTMLTLTENNPVGVLLSLTLAAFCRRLQSNSLTGTLPADWSELGSIQRMWLQNNDLDTPLPASWSALGDTLAASQLRLTGNSKIESSDVPAEWNQGDMSGKFTVNSDA